MWFPSNSAKEFLNSFLKLPATGKEQDWEIELSNPNRLLEFIIFLEKTDLSYDQKQALIALILASFEDADWQGILTENLWNRFTKQVSPEIDNLKDVMSPWLACEGDDFKISKRVRDLIDRSSLT